MAKKGISVEQAKKDMHDKAVKALEEGLMIIQADAMLKVGVDTGTLRRSLTHQIEDKGNILHGEVGSYGVDYAYFHALQNDYLESSLDENIESIRNKIKEVLSE